MKKIFLLIAPIFASSDLFSQTVVSGNITGVWDQASSPYIVDGTIYIVDSLIIQPGVIVQFSGGGNHIEAGGGDKFIAKGTFNDPIFFEAQSIQNPGTWNSLYFNGSGVDDTLIYCDIKSSTDGIYITGGSSTFISNCNIHHNSGYGIYLFNNASPFITNCTIFENSNGIRVYALDCGYTAKGTIYKCLIFNNYGFGITVRSACTSAYADPDIINCTVVANGSTGIDIYENVGSADATITNCIIANNGGFGIANNDGSNVGTNDVTYNCLWNNVSGSYHDLAGTGFGQNGSYQNINLDSCDVCYNIYNDPIFIDTINGNYCIQWDSKCIDAGSNILFGTIVMDSDGTMPDMGAILCNQTPTEIYDVTRNLGELETYPNPSSGIFMLSTNKIVTNGTIQIISLTGDVLWEKNMLSFDKIELDIRNFSSGFYLIRVNSNQGQFMGKIIVRY